jgi:polyhydroxybutyrate depolymerase
VPSRAVGVLACLMLLPFVLAGCRGAPAATGTVGRSIDVGGLSRTYLLHVPPGLNGPAPLVVMLHGGFGSAAQAEQSYGWDALADAQHVVVAYPDGLNRAWNTGGGCCGRPAADNVDDVGFVTAMVAAVEREVPVDPARLFATGISNGGIMAYTLACRTTLFAAIGPVAATQLGDCPSPAPVSVVHVHGTADKAIPYGGGRGQGVAHIDGPGAPEVISSWRTVDRCGEPTTSVAGAVTTSVADCADGRAVELVTVAGAGHGWPGSTRKPGVERLLGLDPPAPAPDTTALVWQFFSAH